MSFLSKTTWRCHINEGCFQILFCISGKLKISKSMNLFMNEQPLSVIYAWHFTLHLDLSFEFFLLKVVLFLKHYCIHFHQIRESRYMRSFLEY